MKSSITLSLLLCIASAFEIREPRNAQRERLGSMVQNVVVSSRIANGETAAANQFPYQAGLKLYDGQNYHFCGGSLISHEWVLTAADCTLTAVKVIVYLGSITYLDSIAPMEVDKCDIKVHHEFDMATARNDIALIKIPYVIYSDAIEPVSLPKCDSIYRTYVHKTVVASGWGYTSDRCASISPILQFANFRVVSNEVCAKEFGSFMIDNGKICTGTVNRIGSCSGDSGGPLVLASSKLQIGIMSLRSNKGCESNAPALRTRITSYLYWIRANTGLTL
ncbi:collagenase-like [Eurosta solidaginis]|uniref:collagenase-like n=1 Tax=Eurosta solidaginis TaxID=178769 RepID=UPI0035314060